MKLADLLINLGRLNAYSPKILQVFGVEEGLLLCQLTYWAGKQSDQDGWIYKTQEELEEETGLSAKKQRTARKKLVALGILEEREERLKHRKFYRINTDKMEEIWLKHPMVTSGTFAKCRSGSSGGAVAAVRLTESTAESTSQDMSSVPSGTPTIPFRLERESTQKSKPPDKDPAEMTTYLARLLLSNVQAGKKIRVTPARLKASRGAIEKMIRLDGIDAEDIYGVILWLDKQRDREYAFVVESGCTLRRKWVRICAMMQREKRPATETEKPFKRVGDGNVW